ncbi:MAG: HAMP domain-containing protein [Pararhodobacter sp.]|nr:HAMP domain-containing protein [Pararhodobacter sp.]
MEALRDEAEAYLGNLSRTSTETVNSTYSSLLIGAGAILVLGVAIATFLSISLSRSLRQTVDQTSRLAEGDLSVDITGSDHRSELGDLSRALLVFKENAEETRRLTAEAEAKRAEDDERQKREMAKQQRVVNDISDGLNRLAAGDLMRHIESPSNNPFPSDYEDLRMAYNGVVDQLSGIVSRIGLVADSVRAGSGEINAASQDLSSRAETQAATLEESAAALNQLTESVRSTAQRASAAEKSSQDNRAHADTGAQIVREAMNAMKGIEHSSEQITRIIGVIDDIAFQTNLLALNAGVEAARAGEAGRGFAVVASEVRGLAQRASESAREIKTLIRESATQVEAGSALVNRTGESLEEILRRAAEVSGLVAEIAVAASEQASGLDEINTGVNQLDQVTQQNAAVAEETTAAATSLLQKAEELTHELSGFQTGGAVGQIVPLAAPASKAAVAPRTTNWAAAPAPKAAAGGGGNLWRDF